MLNSQEINEVAIMFGHLIRSQMSIAQRRLEEEGLCRAQPGIVHALSQCEGSTQVELAQKLGVTAATISAMLKRMERDEVIERRRSEADQRVTHVYLTEKGKSQARIVNQIFKELNLRSFGNFSKEELEQTRAIFSKLIANFSD